MADANTLEVKILEKEYLVACPDEKKHALREAAEHLDKKMREIRASGKVHGTERIAVMAALNITYEMMESSASQIDQQTFLDSLEKRLDEALPKA
ncbi:MAG: cell division protein ZapA [Oleiphilaceae bacterium]|nr:cell division protein ZapA [Oleiphilaceae bacterium]